MSNLFRTLPLSLSGPVMGIALAAAGYHVDWKTAVFLLLAVTFLHMYSVSSKEKSYNKIKNVSLVLTIVCGLAMLYFSFGTLLLMEPLILIVFGYMIVRAVRHTAFVSRGKGILYVFLLFGLLGVAGSYYVCSHSFGGWPMIFPALASGFICVGAKADCDRRTFILLMNVAGWLFMTVYASLRMFDIWHFLYVLSLPAFLIRKPEWAAFAFSLLSGIGFVIFLV